MANTAIQGQGCGRAFLVVWLLGWSAGALAFDSILAWQGYHQCRTVGFVPAHGVITKSEVTVDDDEDGPMYDVAVQYTYAVNGRDYSGDRYQYGAMNSNRAHEIVESLPPDKSVTVYYDPADPSDAVLVAGIGSPELFPALFATPFNIIMLGGWLAVVRTIWPSTCKPGSEPQESSPTRSKDAAQAFPFPLTWTPLVAAGATALAISIVAIFAVGFSTRCDPSPRVMAGVWGLMLAASIVVYVRQRRKATG